MPDQSPNDNQNQDPFAGLTVLNNPTPPPLAKAKIVQPQTQTTATIQTPTPVQSQDPFSGLTILNKPTQQSQTPQEQVMSKITYGDPAYDPSSLGNTILNSLGQQASWFPRTAGNLLSGAAHNLNIENFLGLISDPKQGLQDLWNAQKDLYDQSKLEPNPVLRAIKATGAGIPLVGPMSKAFVDAIQKGDYDTAQQIIGQAGSMFAVPEASGDLAFEGLPKVGAKGVTKVFSDKFGEFQKLQDLQKSAGQGFEAGKGMSNIEIQPLMKDASDRARATATDLDNRIQNTDKALDLQATKVPTDSYRYVTIENPKAGGARPNPNDPNYQIAMQQWRADQQPIQVLKPIQSPVDIGLATNYANKMADSLQKMVPNIPSVTNRVKDLFTTFKSLANEPEALDETGQGKGTTVIEYPRAKAMISQLNEIINQIPKENKTAITAYSKLRDNLNLDLGHSIKNDWQPQASQVLDNLQNLREHQKNLENNPMYQQLSSLGVEGNYAWEPVLKQALNSQTDAENFLRATGGNQQVLAGAALQDLGTRYLKDNDTLDAAGMLHELTTTNKNTLKTALPKQTYDNLQEFLTNLKNTQNAPKPNYPGQIFKPRTIRLLSIPSELIGSTLLGHLPIGAAMGAGTYALTGIYSKLDKLMSDPVSAQAMIDLSKGDSIPSARTLRAKKIIVNALKGNAGLNLQNINTGKQMPVAVNQNGQIVPANQQQ